MFIRVPFFRPIHQAEVWERSMYAVRTFYSGIEHSTIIIIERHVSSFVLIDLSVLSRSHLHIEYLLTLTYTYFHLFTLLFLE